MLRTLRTSMEKGEGGREPHILNNAVEVKIRGRRIRGDVHGHPLR